MWRLMLRGSLITMIVTTSACGSGDNDTVSSAQFKRQGNVLCRDKQAKIGAVFTNFPDKPSRGQMRDVIRKFVPILTEFRDGLRRLGAPKNQREDYGAYLALLNQAIDRDKAAQNDPVKAEAEFNQAGEEKLTSLERKLGLNVCARANG